MRLTKKSLDIISKRNTWNHKTMLSKWVDSCCVDKLNATITDEHNQVILHTKLNVLWALDWRIRVNVIIPITREIDLQN